MQDLHFSTDANGLWDDCTVFNGSPTCIGRRLCSPLVGRGRNHLQRMARGGGSTAVIG